MATDETYGTGTVDTIFLDGPQSSITVGVTGSRGTILVQSSEDACKLSISHGTSKFEVDGQAGSLALEKDNASSIKLSCTGATAELGLVNSGQITLNGATGALILERLLGAPPVSHKIEMYPATASIVVNGGNMIIPDYVFDSDYKLSALDDLKRYIADNKRLPGMVSAEDANFQGVDLVRLSMKLMEKVEELTLHVIQLNDRIRKLESA